MPFRYIVFI